VVRKANVWYDKRIWKKAVWYTLEFGVGLDEALASLEKKNYGWSEWSPESWEVGMWEKDTPLMRALESLKK